MTNNSANRTLNPVDASVSDDLDRAQQDLAQHLSHTQNNHSFIELRTVAQNSFPYSVIRIVQAKHSDGSEKTYYIKRLLTAESRRHRAEDQCRKEAGLLRELKTEMGDEIVDLVLARPERLTIITAACSGVQFSQFFRGYLVRQHLPGIRKSIIETSMRCGIWLKRFHSLTSNQGEDIFQWVKFQCGEVQWRVNELPAFDPENRLLYENVAKKLQEEFSKLQLPARYSMIHRDFAPHNIFVNPDHIQVLDFTETQKGHGAIDVVNYIASIASRCEHPLVSKTLARNICTAFLNAYGGIHNEEKKLYTLLFALQSMKRLLVLHQSASTGVGHQAGRKGMTWHKKYLSRFATDPPNTDAQLKGPWPFLDLVSFGC